MKKISRKTVDCHTASMIRVYFALQQSIMPTGYVRE